MCRHISIVCTKHCLDLNLSSLIRTQEDTWNTNKLGARPGSSLAASGPIYIYYIDSLIYKGVETWWSTLCLPGVKVLVDEHSFQRFSSTWKISKVMSHGRSNSRFLDTFLVNLNQKLVLNFYFIPLSGNYVVNKSLNRATSKNLNIIKR